MININNFYLIMGEMQKVYCVPIDETGNDILEDTMLAMPLDNLYSQEESTNNLLRMLLNFGSVSVLIIMTMIGAPFLYKLFISDIIKNENENMIFNKEDVIPKENRLATSEKMASILILFTSFIMLSGFITSNNDKLTGMMGLFIIIVFFIGFARIQFEKSKGAKDFYRIYLDIQDHNNEKFSSGINFENISQRFTWITYKTSIYTLIGLYILVIGLYITYYFLSDSYLNMGIIILFSWFPLFLNTFLFKEK